MNEYPKEYYYRFPGWWSGSKVLGNYEFMNDGVRTHITAVGKSEKHAKTMLRKKLKGRGIEL